VAQYGYDANGNRTSETTPAGTTSATYDAQDRLQQYGTTAYAYTASGMLQAATDTATGATTSYAYDALGNLTAVTLTNGTRIDYLVDGVGPRIGKKVDGTLVQGFLYGAEAGPLAELDGQGNIVSRFAYGTRGNGNMAKYMVKGGETYRIIADSLVSPAHTLWWWMRPPVQSRGASSNCPCAIAD
jgi:YD repeat-containing protein